MTLLTDLSNTPHTPHTPHMQGIHMTWLPLSREGKFHRMRDGMLYHDKPEYYNQPLFITAGVGESVEEVCRRCAGQPR